jgi:hypothetical protein
MRQMNFGTYTQYSFWGNVEYQTDKDAMLKRNELAKELKAKGYRVVKRSLKGQTRKYSSLGNPDGTTGTVYYLDAYPTN